MKTKLVTILTVCATIAACAPDEQETSKQPVAKKTEAPQIAVIEDTRITHGGLSFQGKVDKINLNKLENNISLESTEANGSEVFSGILNNLNDFSSNMVMQSALNHNILDGKAFSDNIALNLLFDKTAKKTHLTPVVTPEVMMSANYSTIHISLHAATAYQNAGVKKQYESKYTTQKLIPNNISAEKNKEYWINNPLELKENIVNGLYEVSQQFANDFNTSAIK